MSLFMLIRKNIRNSDNILIIIIKKYVNNVI